MSLPRPDHEPQFPKSPESERDVLPARSPAFVTVARLLATDPTLAAESLANLIASEREAARAEALGEAAAAIEGAIEQPPVDADGTIWHGSMGHSSGLQCDLCPGYPHAACIHPRAAAAIVRDLANTT